MKSTQKAFTLVELIVVITILAILGTIAFISLGSYTGDARNAKRTDAISKIATSIENSLIDSKKALAFVAGNTSRIAGPTLIIAGEEDAAVTEADYNAGATNYTALGIKGDDFRDPDADVAYPLGATKANKYEVAATLEDDAGDSARVMGNWAPRDANPVDGTRNGTDAQIFTLDNAGDINLIRKGDLVDFNGTPAITDAEVLKISRDGQTITIADTSDIAADATTVTLAAGNEIDGLIGAFVAGSLTTTPVTDGGSNFAY